MRRLARLTVLGLVAATALPALASSPVEKPVRTLIGAVRYEKDALALEHLAGDAQGEVLLGEDWKKATPAQRKEFVALFHTLFSAIAFPQIRDNFQHLETIVYEDPAVTGGKASLGSTLVILHPVKKQEMKVRYELVREGGAWKVLDVQVLGVGQPSFLAMIRDEQVRPLFEEGGWSHLLGLMRARAQEVSAH